MTNNISEPTNTYVVNGVGTVDFSVEIAATSREEAEAIFEESAALLVRQAASVYYSNHDVHYVDDIEEIDEDLVD